MVMYFGLVCALLKIPGIVFSGILAVCLLLAAMNLESKRSKTVLTLLLLIIFYVAFRGVDIALPGDFVIHTNTGKITIPYLGSFELVFHQISSSMIETLFLALNWNLLWYIAFFGICLRVAQYRKYSLRRPEFVASVLSISFIFFVFYFSKHYVSAVDFTTVNRALMYPVPVLIFLLFRYFPSERASKTQLCSGL